MVKLMTFEEVDHEFPSSESFVVHWVIEGVESGFEACCIDFFVRSLLRGVMPLEAGGKPDPWMDGYVRCPKCVRRLER